MSLITLRPALADLPGFEAACTENGFELAGIDHDEVELVEAESGNSFLVFRVEDWFQVRALILAPEQVEAVKAGFFRSLIKLQFRVLGCRFGTDDEGALWLMEDVYPTSLPGASLVQVAEQLHSVADQTLDLINALTAQDQTITDREIDVAFNVV